MDKEYTPAEAKAWLNGYDAGKTHAKKAWVSLTDEEINQIYICAMSDRDFIFDTQAKLKEKNK
jgi:hypothetical protein